MQIFEKNLIFADMSKNRFGLVGRIVKFYADGFRQMTWGKTLWLIIFIKLFIMFVVLRIFFFKPTLGGLTEEQKSEVVGRAIE